MRREGRDEACASQTRIFDGIWVALVPIILCFALLPMMVFTKSAEAGREARAQLRRNDPAAYGGISGMERADALAGDESGTFGARGGRRGAPARRSTRRWSAGGEVPEMTKP